MAGGNVADFWASFSVKTDASALARVDRYLSSLSQKLEKYQKQFNKKIGFDALFKVNERLLTRSLGDALDRASKSLVFEVSRFAANERNLKAAILQSFRKVSKSVTFELSRFGLNGGGYLPPAEWDRRRAVSKQDRLDEIEAKRKMYELGHKDRMEALRYKNDMYGSRSKSRYFDAGFHVPTTSHFMRYGMDSLPFIGGAIGLAALNKHSQTLQANDMALSASAGNPQDAKKYSEFLNNLGERLGKTTATMTPFFSQMLAGAKGTKLEPHLMEGFTSLMEYSSVMMLDDGKVKGTIRAFTQMIGKQQIMAEELRGQAAEHLPPIVRLMADVAAGGDTKKLNEMMKKGQLDPNVHLPMLFKRLREESAPLLPKYFKTSVFAQGYMGKQAEDLLKAFSQNGGDSGFARIFKEIAESFKKLEPLTKSLGKAFDELSVALQAPIRLFGDLGPLVTDISNLFGTSETNVIKFAAAGALLATKWGRVGAIFSAVALVLEDISFGVQGKDSYTKDFFEWIEKFTPIEKKLMGVSAALLAIAAAMKAISVSSKLPGLDSVLGGGGSSDNGGKGKKNAGRFGLFGALGVAGVTAGLVGYGLDQAGVFDRAASIKDQRTALYGEIQNPYSPLYQDTNVDKAWSQYREGQERSGGTADFQSWLNNYVQQRTANAENKYGTVPLMAQYQNHKEEQQAIQQTNNITVNANIEVKAENPEEGARKFSQMLQNELTNTLQFFNNTR